MASSYSTDLKLELMVTGENSGTWGDKTNTNLNLVQQAIAGYEAIDVASADVTLAMTNATLSNARNMVLSLTGTLAANRNVNVPDGIEKTYIVADNTTRAGFTLTIKTVSGTGVTIPAGKTGYLYQGVMTAQAGADATGNMFVRYFGESAFRIGHTFEISGDGGEYFYSFAFPVKIPEKSDIDVRATVRSNNGRYTAAFDLLLVDN